MVTRTRAYSGQPTIVRGSPVELAARWDTADAHLLCTPSSQPACTIAMNPYNECVAQFRVFVVALSVLGAVGLDSLIIRWHSPDVDTVRFMLRHEQATITTTHLTIAHTNIPYTYLWRAMLT